MNGIAAALNELQYPAEPTPASRHARRDPGLHVHHAKPDYICKIERTKVLIVWDVQEDGVGINAKRRQFRAAFCFPQVHFPGWRAYTPASGCRQSQKTFWKMSVSLKRPN